MGFVSIVATVETVWVLDRAGFVERLLQVEVLTIENEQEVFTAMVALRRRGNLQTLIGSLGRGQGVRAHRRSTRRQYDFPASNLCN